ncbi:MAG TPA: FG-GAP-like repeat-containing protein [Candidatus Kryptonia bacterium]|nr:FG-GAP-like repeat-containing protein [Candidatus Kryptonia bacterium]
MRRFTRLVALAWCVVLASTAHAEFPYPSNPHPCTNPLTDPLCIDATAFARYLFLPTTVPPTRPDDFGSDNWKLTSDTTGDPTIDASAQELYGVKGASVDLAWQVTTGRPDVRIAILDSGIRWADNLPDLLNKLFLNRGELPVPEGSSNTRDPYDRNGDGVFNIQDYLADGTHPQDSRVSDQNGNGVIDPEDLIFIFSDGVDNDHNGYVDDISGWDFFEDDNDPLDEVRYGHGTGEAEDSSAEANNGSGDPGTCPNCVVIPVRVGDSFVADVNAFAQGVVYAVDNGARVVQEALGTLNQTRFAQEAIDYAYRNGVVVIASAADEESNHHNYPANFNHTVEVNSVTKFDELGGITQTPQSYLYLNGCTNYGGHIAVTVPSSSCSSEATGKSSGIAGLIVSAALDAVDQGTLSSYRRDDGTLAPFPLSADEIKQLLTQTADDINFDARTDVTPPEPRNYATKSPFPGVLHSERFHSIAGFDQYFGYGRVNANRAVRAVAAGQIPPEVSIESPAWFETIDPVATPTLSISGRVAMNRVTSNPASGVSLAGYTVQVAPGVQPAESDFVTVVTSSAVSIDGELGTIDLTALENQMPHGVTGPALNDDGSPDPDRFTFTVRVRAVDPLGNRGEDRRAFALHHDPDLLPGFPIQLGSDGVASPVTADLDGDGLEEIVIGTSNGAVHAFRFDGSEVAGWPVFTDPLELHTDAPGYASGAVPVPVYGSVLGAVAVGDLDRDGRLEVVATDLPGKVYVWNRDGTRRPGFPVSTLADYSNTRRSERDLGMPSGRVPDLVNRHNGDNRVGRALAGGPALGNLDHSPDGSLEIVAGAFDRHLYAWRNTGEPVPGWPVLLKDPAKVMSVDPITNEVTLTPDADAAIGTKIIVPPSLGDLDGDGQLEVVAAVNEEYSEEPNALFTNLIVNLYRSAGAISPGNTRVYAVYADGVAHGGSGLNRGWNPSAFLPGWPVKTALVTTGLLPTVGSGSDGSPALADVDGDGRLEVATGSVVGPLYVFDVQGESILGRADSGQDLTFATDRLGAQSNSPDSPSFGSLGAPVLAEFNGPGHGFFLLSPAAGLGKLIDNQLAASQTPADNQLNVWPVTLADGSPASGAFSPAFPRVVNDLQFFSAPALADIDADGQPEAIEGSGVSDLHAFNIDGHEPPGWPKFTGGWMIGAPAVGDINGDGKLEVVASTREGHLFAWRTTGDECGVIPWRRFHHDEWGTGNYHTDARPPGSTSAPHGAQPLSPNEAEIGVDRVPGDNLYCGTAQFDVRFAETPITTDADFANATRAAGIQSPSGSRIFNRIVIQDARFAARTLYFALVAIDAAGNRSELLPLGMSVFPPEPTATPTPSATVVSTVTPTQSPTVTQTSSAADSAGCRVDRRGAGTGLPALLPLLAFLSRRRKRGS